MMACKDSLEGQYTRDLALTNSFVIEGSALKLNLSRDYGAMYFVAKATSTVDTDDSEE